MLSNSVIRQKFAERVMWLNSIINFFKLLKNNCNTAVEFYQTRALSEWIMVEFVMPSNDNLKYALTTLDEFS